MRALSARQRGLLVALTGAISIGVDPLGARFQTAEANCAFWPYAFWRCLVFSSFTMCIALIKAGGPRGVLSGMRAIGWTLPLLVFLMGAAETLMLLGLVNTTVAKCLLLFSLNPLWAAAFGRVILHERMRRPTAVALLLSLVSMCVVLLPPALGADDSPSDDRNSSAVVENTSTAVGDVSAAFAGLVFALYLVLARRAAQLSDGKADLPAAAAFGGYLAMLFALALSAAVVAPPSTIGFDVGRFPAWSFWLAVLAQGCGVGFALVCLSIAPKLASAAEVCIVMLLQLLLSPLWVALVFGEVPPIWTVVGGLLLIATLAGHEIAMQRLTKADESHAAAAADTTTTAAVEIRVG